MFTTAVVFVGAVTAPAIGQTLVLAPVADTTIFQNNADPAGLLSSGSGEALFTGHTSGQVDVLQRALVRFNTSAIPCGSVITGVELTMTLLRAGGGGSPVPVELHRLQSAWGEGASVSFSGSGGASAAGDANWLQSFHPGTNWDTAGGDFVAAASAMVNVGLGSSVVWATTPGLIADVSAWVSDPSLNHGWLLLSEEAAFGTARKLASREYFNAASRPSLRIIYGPGCLADLPLAESGCPDGVVDGSDFITFINSFSTGDLLLDSAADVNHDGVIDGGDFIEFINAFSAGC